MIEEIIYWDIPRHDRDALPSENEDQPIFYKLTLKNNSHELWIEVLDWLDPQIKEFIWVGIHDLHFDYGQSFIFLTYDNAFKASLAFAEYL